LEAISEWLTGAPLLSQVAPGFGDELLLSPATSDVLRLLPKPRLSTGGQDTECKYAYEYESQDDVVRG